MKKKKIPKTPQKYKNLKSNKNKTGYRGRGNINRREKTFSVLLVNMRGYKSKERSLMNLIKKVQPSCVTLNETQLAGRAKVSLAPYTSWTKNRATKGGGGVATAVSERFKNCSVSAGEGEGEDEFLVTRVECFRPALCIINCYGEQRKTSKDEVEKKWRRLRDVMEGVRARNELCLLIGDLNKLVGTGALGIPGNSPEISLGGKLLRELLATGNWSLVNGLAPDIVIGGPFTRKDPATGNLSCLDLCVVSCELLPYVHNLVIDSGREMAVARAVKMGKTFKMVYSDHFTCLLTFTNLPRRKEAKKEKKVVWNLAKEGGWDQYKVLTDVYSEALRKVIETDNTVEEKMNKFEKIHDKIKYKAFGKVTIGGKLTNKSEDFVDVLKEGEQAEALFEEQVRKANDAIEDIKKLKIPKAGKIWEIRKEVLGGKKACLEATAIIHPESGKLVVSRREIKEISLEYCKSTLRNNVPSEDYHEHIQSKIQKVKVKVSEGGGESKINRDTFNCVLAKFKKSGKKNYDFLVKSGKQFQEVVFKFCLEMIEKETFPSSFKQTTLHMIFKGGQGRRHNLADNRFIHSKPWWPRLAEGLIVEEGLKQPLVEGSSVYQIGGQPGHRSEEHLCEDRSRTERVR